MKGKRYDPEQFFDPVKLADDVVFALSSLQRSGEVSTEFLEEGIRLCDYLMHILQGLKSPDIEAKKWTSRALHDDRKALREGGIRSISTEHKKTEKMKRWIKDLINAPSSHSQEEIESIKEHLMTITMPIWRSLTSEFRERKLKRSLVIRG